ncbi:hypothetical protein ACWGJX_42420 [Streptomyces sp. NPDC054775]
MAGQLDARRSADLQDDEYRSWAYKVYCQPARSRRPPSLTSSTYANSASLSGH